MQEAGCQDLEEALEYMEACIEDIELANMAKEYRH